MVFLALSLAFATLGAWPVLPFAGAELAVVYWAFRTVDRQAGDYESLRIDGDRLLIETQTRGRRLKFECNRYWAQVGWSAGANGQHACLTIRSQGKEVQFGRHLPERELREVAARIRQHIGLN